MDAEGIEFVRRNAEKPHSEPEIADSPGLTRKSDLTTREPMRVQLRHLSDEVTLGQKRRRATWKQGHPQRPLSEYPSPSAASLFPYNTVLEGVQVVIPGGTLHIDAGVYPEGIVASRPMILRTTGGTVRIGP